MSKMNRLEERNIISYNKKANNYTNSPEGRFTEKFKVELLNSITLKDEQKVLDVGCGNGRLLQMLEGKANIKGYGIDISGDMIINARENEPNMVFESARCEDIPFESGFFDVIVVCASYHHFQNVDLFAREAKRLLKSNGYIYIAEIYYKKFVRKIVNPFVKFLSPDDFKFYSPGEIIKTFSKVGFSKTFVSVKDNVQIICLKNR